MYNAIERYKFTALMQDEGVPEQVSRLVLRDSVTLTRLAAAMCNGDYPCDNGERHTVACDECGLGYAPRSMTKVRQRGDVVSAVCPECRTQARITERLKPYHVTPIFGGDPRGCVLKLTVPSGKTDDWGSVGVCVPA